MYYIITFLAALIVGLIVGVLFARKNYVKLQKTEDSGKKLLDALKGR
jgi:uncharacterized membrane-anchored protein YhcB (DUF1043 family)